MSTLNRSFRAVGVVSLLAAAGAAHAQVVAPGILVADRDTDSIWLLRDCDSNNSIDAATEVKLFYSGANAAGTQGIANPSMIAARPDGLVLLGDADASGRHWLWLRDLNRDGDALDAGESGVFVNASNPSGFLFGFPGGAAFDNAGAAYVSNAGNAFGADAIYRCFDLNGNGSVNDADEVTPYCTTGLFGPGNGSYGPQELTFGTDGALYMRNATPNLHGIYRFVDTNANNDANDVGESAPFFDSSNASGITQSSGFAIEPDRANPGAFYTAQVATGSLDQIIRVRDLNDNDTANDAGEATVVWSTTESGFNIVDVVSLPDGRLFVTGASGAQILVLQDVGNDGTFTQPEDRTTFFANGQASLQTARQIAYLYAAADVNGSFSVTADDIFAYLDRWFAQTGQSGASLSADFNNDGTVTADDIFAFLDAWFNPTLGC